jgi:hypothetical protein
MRTSLGQRSFCPLPSSNYISIENCMENCFSDTRGSSLCVGKNEVAILYNLLGIFRLSSLARNAEKQNQYKYSMSVGCYV